MKIRFKTWYWGKYILSGSYLDGSYITYKTPGFELYDEDKHGLHNENIDKIEEVIKNEKEKI